MHISFNIVILRSRSSSSFRDEDTDTQRNSHLPNIAWLEVEQPGCFPSLISLVRSNPGPGQMLLAQLFGCWWPMGHDYQTVGLGVCL